MKPFLDPDNKFRWFITHDQRDSQTGEVTGDTVTSWFRYEADFELGMIRYGDNMIAFGVYDL